MAIRRLVAEKLMWETLKRWKQSSPEMDRIQFLKTVPFFNELTLWQIKKVSEIVFERSFDSDELIFEQGQPGAALFLVIHGQVSIERYDKQIHSTLAVIDRGAFFGELALLDESPRSATARAMEPTRTLALYRNDLHRLINSDPQTACHIYRALARIVGDRLRSTNELFAAAPEVEKKAAA